MSSSSVLAAWHAAVNAGDVDTAVGLCDANVAVRGQRGVGHGTDLMRGWLTRSGIRLEPRDDLEETDGRFVVRELARWTTAGAPDGAPVEPTETWVVFTVDEDRLTSVARYETRDDVPAP